jgi:hypothetical protein
MLNLLLDAFICFKPYSSEVQWSQCEKSTKTLFSITATCFSIAVIVVALIEVVVDDTDDVVLAPYRTERVKNDYS